MVAEPPPPKLSVVVPLLNEAPNLEPLHREVAAAMDELALPWELVFVDDGSRDSSPQVLARLRADDHVRVVTLDRNYGQSTAMIAGAEAARGKWVATLDADGQNDPRDLVRLWRQIEEGGCDGVIGVRQRRADSWVRRVSSRIANGVRNRMLGDSTTDVGCSTRILRRRALLEAHRFEGMHRFLPLLVRAIGYELREVPVHHRPRRAGESKYGINNRLWRGIADMLMVHRLLRRTVRYRTKPEAPDSTDPAREAYE
jgi:dolichol-phosphate mannosyltransferase